jgi:hypothetical protein
VCKLHRSLYGLRQSPRAWYSHVGSDLCSWDLHKITADSNVYYREYHGHIIILILYVDDLYITGSNAQGIVALKCFLVHTYEMTDLGLLRKFLGVQFLQIDHSVLLHQEDYVNSLLAEYKMLHTPPMYVPISDSIRLSKATQIVPINPYYYQHLVGELNYLTKTHWDIGFVVSLLSSYMHRPQKTHLTAAFSILQYL